VTTSSCRPTPTAAPTATVQPGRPPVGHRALDRDRSPTSSRCAPPSARADPHGVGRDADQPAARHRRHRRHRGGRPRGRCTARRRQHLRHERTCRSRSRSAPTSSCTPRRSTPAGTATSSAAPSSSPRAPRPATVSRSAERIAFHQNAMGAVAGPFDAWLVLRGLKTLAVRMERHCDNAEKVVEFLQGHDGVTAVHYPGLPDHPGHDVAARQMRRFGGMVVLPRQGRRGRRGQGLRRDPAVDPRRVPRWRRVAHRAPGPDDPRLGRRHRARGAG
jgi:hypothetical protein